MPSVELDLTLNPVPDPETPPVFLLTVVSSARYSPDPEPNPPALTPKDEDEKKELPLLGVKMFFSRPADPEVLDMPLLADALKPRGGKDVILVVEIVVSVMPLSPELPPE